MPSSTSFYLVDAQLSPLAERPSAGVVRGWRVSGPSADINAPRYRQIVVTFPSRFLFLALAPEFPRHGRR